MITSFTILFTTKVTTLFKNLKIVLNNVFPALFLFAFDNRCAGAGALRLFYEKKPNYCIKKRPPRALRRRWRITILLKKPKDCNK